MADEAVQAYYARDEERDRLAQGLGLVEFLRTTEVIGRTLPTTPSVVADIGGGPGRYTAWLADLGHRVLHRDIVELHVDHVRAAQGESVDTAVGDARSLDIGDDAVDAVLLLGPLYHLEDADDRLQALREARRIVKPGGYVYAAAISRWAARLHGMLVERAHVRFPAIRDMVVEAERTGVMAPVHAASFNGYGHRPDELVGEITASGLSLDALVNVEGIAFAFDDIAARLDDPGERTVLFDAIRATEAVPELLGVGPHLLAVGHKLQ